MCDLLQFVKPNLTATCQQVGNVILQVIVLTFKSTSWKKGKRTRLRMRSTLTRTQLRLLCLSIPKTAAQTPDLWLSVLTKMVWEWRQGDGGPGISIGKEGWRATGAQTAEKCMLVLIEKCQWSTEHHSPPALKQDLRANKWKQPGGKQWVQDVDCVHTLPRFQSKQTSLGCAAEVWWVEDSTHIFQDLKYLFPTSHNIRSHRTLLEVYRSPCLFMKPLTTYKTTWDCLMVWGRKQSYSIVNRRKRNHLQSSCKNSQTETTTLQQKATNAGSIFVFHEFFLHIMTIKKHFYVLSKASHVTTMSFQKPLN